MADYISREVARERLNKACKKGKILMVIVLLLGLLYAGLCALIAMDIKVPDMVYNIMLVIVPLMSDKILAAADCGTRGFIFLLTAIIGLLMFGKIAKTGDAFRSGQLKQLRVISVLTILLGFMPTLVGNGVKAFLAVRSGNPPIANMSLAIDVLCIGIGVLMFAVTRVQVAGGVLKSQEALIASDPIAGGMTEPNFANVPDISSMTTAIPATQVASTQASGMTAVKEAASSDGLGVDATQADQSTSSTGL
ncbi:MAG: hypothetical protein J6D34_10935 [Atopobiaceae bacterium]|nr:hypothetical protein [Atopobiaceae bacterium]